MWSSQGPIAGTVGGYCLLCNQELYYVWNASKTFVLLLDHMHEINIKEEQ